MEKETNNPVLFPRVRAIFPGEQNKTATLDLEKLCESWHCKEIITVVNKHLNLCMVIKLYNIDTKYTYHIWQIVFMLT